MGKNPLLSPGMNEELIEYKVLKNKVVLGIEGNEGGENLKCRRMA